MALRHDEDTEFNDALRKQGILPPLKPATPSPSPPTFPSDPLSRLHASSSSDSLTLDSLEDELPSSVLEEWRAKRAEELRGKEGLVKGKGRGGVRPIGREDYAREVNEASEKNLEDHEEGGDRQPGTGVVLCLHNPAPPSQHLLSLLESLSTLHPRTHFLSIPGPSCIPNYPAQNHPTLICYRAGQCVKQIVGLGSESGGGGRLRGLKTTWRDVEAVLMDCGVLDADLKDLAAETALKAKDEESGTGRTAEEEAEDGMWDFDDSGLRPRKRERGIRGGEKKRRGSDDEDEESDLDI